MQQESSITVPRHLGFIIDGNRRWAKERGLPTLEGHRRGYEKVKDLLVEAIERGAQFASAYIFSTENWERSEEEVSYLMGLVLKLIERDLNYIIARDVRIKILGSRERLSKKVAAAVERAEQKSAHCTKGTLALCFNYGGQMEIADAVKNIVREGLSVEDITPETIQAHLYAPDVPQVDMVIRTSGEQRLSNFMLWRSAYSEFMFIKKYWPDMTSADLDDIFGEYAKRNRRFGGN
jgi:undecaprenyl diphosphate synthase